MENSGRIKRTHGYRLRGGQMRQPCLLLFVLSRYSFIASFTMSFSDMFFLMARNFIRV